MTNKIIAIDGYSSTGKSTIAKQLAKQLNFLYIDTGAMFRAITLYTIENNLINDGKIDISALTSQLNKIYLSFKSSSPGSSEIYMNGRNIEADIRNLKIANLVSDIACISEVRQKLLEVQRVLGSNENIVMDGRDIGTVVFPNADLKLFMIACADVRAKRRYNELTSNGKKVDYYDVLENIKSRDYKDTHRELSPLKKASDAVEIDNTELNVDSQLKMILKLIKSKT